MRHTNKRPNAWFNHSPRPFMNDHFDLQDIQALIIDIDGTLWRGRTPMPGLVPFFGFLQRRALSFIIVTNNSVETPAQYQQKLAGFGVEIQPDQILTCSLATAAYLKQEHEGAVVYVIGETGLRQALGQAGFSLTDKAAPPAQVVVVGGDTGLTYDKLKYAVLSIQRGAQFVGANPDLLIPTEEGLVPEAGTTLAAIQAATGVAPTVIGKPEPWLFELAVKKMGSSPHQTAMLGDRLDTDILGGQRAGLKTILVTTGVDNRESVVQKAIQPNLIVGGLSELVDIWQGEAYDR
ncbi:MAG TPA: HAD-IIA family hydrolase [Anaerolineae bacterium]